jgi:hypothetical protein
MESDGAGIGLRAATSTRSTLDRGHMFWAQTTRCIMVRTGMLRMAKQSVLHTCSVFLNSLFDTLHKFCNNNSRLDRLPPFLTYRSPPGIPARASSFLANSQTGTRGDRHPVPASLPCLSATDRMPGTPKPQRRISDPMYD